MYLDGYSIKDISNYLNRAPGHIRVILTEMGLRQKRDTRNFWTNEELKILIENYSKLGRNELLKLLPNKSSNAIAKKASQLKLQKENNSYIFTQDDDEFIKNNCLLS